MRNDYKNRICKLPAIKTFTKSDQTQALKMLEKGKSPSEVAEQFGVKPDTIYRLRKRMGFVSPAAKSADRSISFRLSEDEFRAFAGLAADCGCKTHSEFARVLVRSAAGFLEMSREKADALEEIRGELGKIGVNVNQIARAANARKVELVMAQWEEIRLLSSQIGSLKTYLNGVVAEARRKGSHLWRKSEYGRE